MTVLLTLVLSASWLAGDQAKCKLICKTTRLSLFCLLDTAWKPPVLKSEQTLILYLEISTLCYSAVVNYVTDTWCYIPSFKTLV
jgi:hypothetical protein